MKETNIGKYVIVRGDRSGVFAVSTVACAVIGVVRPPPDLVLGRRSKHFSACY